MREVISDWWLIDETPLIKLMNAFLINETPSVLTMNTKANESLEVHNVNLRDKN